MAKREIYICDYEYCENRGTNEDGGLPVNWFELKVNRQSNSRTFHICPKHEVVISDPWGGSWVFDHSQLEDKAANQK